MQIKFSIYILNSDKNQKLWQNSITWVFRRKDVYLWQLFLVQLETWRLADQGLWCCAKLKHNRNRISPKSFWERFIRTPKCPQVFLYSPQMLLSNIVHAYFLFPASYFLFCKCSSSSFLENKYCSGNTPKSPWIFPVFPTNAPNYASHYFPTMQLYSQFHPFPFSLKG